LKKNNLLKKRFFSIILTIAVALSMMPTMAWAADEGSTSVGNAVAQIDDRTFTSLPAALNAAEDDDTVKQHEHDMVNGACDCGYVCSHDNRNEDGTCSICDASIIAKVEVDNVTTYHADISDALKAAGDNGKVTIIAEQNSLSMPEELYADGTITLDLNGHRLEDNPLILGGYNPPGSFTIRTGNLMIIDSSDGSGAISLKVRPGAKVRFYGSVGTTCLKLELYSNAIHPADVKFYGGNIRGITLSNTATYADLLPAGYCFYTYSSTGSDLGTAVKLAEAEISEGNYLAVSECTHAEAGDDGKCLYCGIELGIRDNNDNIYTTLQDAITAAVSDSRSNG